MHMTSDGRRPIARALLIGILLMPCAAGSAANTTPVPAGGDLQAAINAARPGDTIELAPGATYVGNFTLPVKEGAEFITIRTAGAAGSDGRRVTPETAKGFAKLRSPNNDPTIATAARSHHWRLVALEILGTTDGDGNIVSLGDGSAAQRSLAQVPHDFVVDRDRKSVV